MATVYIYALTDPRTDIPRYVGKAADPNYRLGAHISEGKYHRLGRVSLKTAWIARLLDLGLEPGLTILEECDVAEWKAREAWWIGEMGRQSIDLCNAAPGGGGR